MVGGRASLAVTAGNEEGRTGRASRRRLTG